MDPQVLNEIRVCIDIGSVKHFVAIGLSSGKHLEGFFLEHKDVEIERFFEHIDELQKQYNMPVVFAMEGYNGYARPIDSYVLAKGYKLYNVNNMKLARFKEIFPAPAKTDEIDAWKIFELFTMKDSLPLAKNALQEVPIIPESNEKLKRFTRRRRILVNERTRIACRMQSDLHAICPGLLSITTAVNNLWFLNFITSRDEINKLAKMHKKSLLKIKGIGKKYAENILQWQKAAVFSSIASWSGEIVIQDAKRMLELNRQIASLEKTISSLVLESTMAKRLTTITGFGDICAGEIIGEIGILERFKSEAGLAYYLGVAVLDKQSGKYTGAKNPRNVNTRAKAALVTAVARHIDHNAEAKLYYDKKRSEGKKHNQAIRSLARHIVRVIWSMLKNERDYVDKEFKAEIQEPLTNLNKVTRLAEEGSTATHSLVAKEAEEKSRRVPSEGSTATHSLVPQSIAI